MMMNVKFLHQDVLDNDFFQVLLISTYISSLCFPTEFTEALNITIMDNYQCHKKLQVVGALTDFPFSRNAGKSELLEENV